MISLSWFDVVKIIGIPMRRVFLSNVVVNRAEFENTLNKLRELNRVPNRLQGVLNNEKSHKVYYDEGVELGSVEVDLSEEESKEMFDEMLKIIAEKTEEFTERQYYSINKIRELLSEAMKAKNNDDKEKVSEIILEITENINPKREFLKDYIPERERLQFLREYLEETEGKAHLAFKNPPQNKKVLEDFAELIGGTVKNDKIFLNIDSYNDFIQILRPKIDKNTKEVLDDEETVKLKEKRLKFYNEKIKNLGISVEIGTTSKIIDPRDLEAKGLNIRGAKFEIIGDFNERSVFKYIEIVEGLKNSKNIWKPTKFPNGDNIAEGLIFLKRASGGGKSLILNPYTSIILNNTFTGNKWFDTFFNALRTSEVLTDDEVEQLIVDDISVALMNNRDETELGIRTASFSRLEKIRNLILTNPKNLKKRLNEAIRSVISENQGEGNLGEEITRRKLGLRREQLALLERYFTVKEANKIESALKEENDEDDIDIFYYDSRGNDVESRNDAFYVDFELFGDKINPSNLKDFVEEKVEGLDESKISELRRDLVRPTDFVSYIQSIASKESINELIDARIGTASSLEQISPKNSLIYLTLMGERLSDDVVGEAFNKINDNPNSDEAKAELEQLNNKIPELLNDIKTNVIGAFKERLQFFLDNYGQKFQNRTNKVQIVPAINGFTRANMIREVQQ